MSSYKVVVTDQVFNSVEIERRLLHEINADLEVADGTVADVVRRGRDADALLNTYLPIDARVLAELGKCKIIARYGIGVDNIDLGAAREAGMVVTNVPDYCVDEVATHALALILALIRRIPEGDALVRAGGWSFASLRPVTRFSELRVGLVGYGKIARRLAGHLAALGASIVVYDPYASPRPGDPPWMSLDQLLEASSVVSLHAPLTPETRGLISATALGKMRADAVLVNTSRGPLVNLDDLIAALRAGRIRGAALDVIDPEPPEPARLTGVPGLIVTPHMAYYSEEAEGESQRKAATQVVKVLTGRSPDYPVGG